MCFLLIETGPMGPGGLKMKKMYKKEEGVSPVIATILMVAITVVLAATVWLMVSGYMGGTTHPQLTGSLTYDSANSNPTNGYVNLTLSMSNPTSAKYENVKVVITMSATTTTVKIGTNGEGTATATINGNSVTFTVKILDQDGSGTLTSGDVIYISSGGVSLDNAQITLSITGYTGTTPAVTIP